MTGDITTEFTVWCAKCDEWQQESAPRKSYAIELFKYSGWKKTKALGWVCPKHAERPSKE